MAVEIHNIRPRSITHQHIYAISNTLISKRSDNTVRILDAGCGNGFLIQFLQSKFLGHIGLNVEVYGFDVADHGVQRKDFIDLAVENLTDALPDIQWKQRVHIVTIGEDWPFEDGYFDLVVCNQVMEHVHDKDIFLLNASRVLKEGGYFVALNPLRHCLWEGHIHLPIAHKLRSWGSLNRYIFMLSVLGLGKYRTQKRDNRSTISTYSERHADYIYFLTSYSSESATLNSARKAGMRASFEFTSMFYWQKIRKILGLALIERYKRGNGINSAFAVKVLRYVSSVTLCCQKKNTY